MAEEMKEGFLCPICMADLGDVIQLQVLKKKIKFHAQSVTFMQSGHVKKF